MYFKNAALSTVEPNVAHYNLILILPEVFFKALERKCPLLFVGLCNEITLLLVLPLLYSFSFILLCVSNSFYGPYLS